MKKKTIIHILFLSIVANSFHRAQAFDIKDYIVQIASGSAFLVGIGFSYIVYGKNYEAERLKQERLLLLEKQKHEEMTAHETAQKNLYELEKKYAHEIDSWQKSGTLSQETLEKSSLMLMPQTRFVHIAYARQLLCDLEKMRTSSFNLPHKEQQRAQEIEEFLKKVLEKNNEIFKSVIAKEFEEEKRALAEDEKERYRIAAEREKYEAKLIKKQCFDDQRKKLAQLYQQAQDSINAVSHNAQEKLNTLSSQASSLYNTNAVYYDSIVRAIHAELNEHGLQSMSQQLKALKKEFEQLRRNSLAADDIKKLNETFARFKQDLLQKIQESRVSKSEVEGICKKIERMETALAVIAADIGDLKMIMNGTTAHHYEPSAPPQDF